MRAFHLVLLSVLAALLAAAPPASAGCGVHGPTAGCHFEVGAAASAGAYVRLGEPVEADAYACQHLFASIPSCPLR